MFEVSIVRPSFASTVPLATVASDFLRLSTIVWLTPVFSEIQLELFFPHSASFSSVMTDWHQQRPQPPVGGVDFVEVGGLVDQSRKLTFEFLVFADRQRDFSRCHH